MTSEILFFDGKEGLVPNDDLLEVVSPIESAKILVGAVDDLTVAWTDQDKFIFFSELVRGLTALFRKVG